MVLKVLWIVVVAQAWLPDFTTASCDTFVGPAGKAECVYLDGYVGAQWATCLSNDYIIEKSRHRHICQLMPLTATRPNYCYYQCQIEVYGQESGLVSGKCKCDPYGNNEAPNLVPNFDNYNPGDDVLDWRKIMRDLDSDRTTTPAPLPDWCSSPDGTQCSWFMSCLDKKYPCEASENGYVIEFAREVCKLEGNYYTDSVVNFSPTGREWVDAVRKCLQVSLVPQIRPWMSPTCKDIKQEALSTQEMCYRSAAPDAPSICDLTCQDWAKFFWTVKSRGSSMKNMGYIEVMKSAVEMMSTCVKNVSIVGDNCPTEILRLTLDTDDFFTLQWHRNQLAGEAVDGLAKMQGWDREVMGWFAYAPNVTDKSSPNVTINILLGDHAKLGLTADSNIRSDLNLTKVVTDLAGALKHGLLYDVADKVVSVSTLGWCQDMECRQIVMHTTAGPKPKALKSSGAHVQVTFIATWLCGLLAVKHLSF